MEHKAIETSGHDTSNFQFFDRRMARLAQRIAVDSEGALWCLQNSWGKENIFLARFREGIRLFAPQERIELNEEMARETAPRILRHDEKTGKLYLIKIGERDEEPGKLLVVDAETGALEAAIETGRTPTDLAVDDCFLYTANFDDDTISRIEKSTGKTGTLKTGAGPFKMARTGTGLFVINHEDNTLQRMGSGSKVYPIPFRGRPDNLACHGEKLIITSHSPGALGIIGFDPVKETFHLLHERKYPYGETTMDTNNSSFYTRGQFGDSIFEITRIKTDEAGRIWITDFLGGKLYIVDWAGE
jgi:hypothetical protein